tara:strand:+ start:1 stop:765 length:765 start_codon:yes stop_codon:yes gene_type:complete
MNKRLIFCLLYKEGFFQLSRNFNLQTVGNLKWIQNNFSFNITCKNIDELIIIHAKDNPSKEEKKKFLSTVNNLRKKIFIPLSIGGGIRNMDDAKNYFDIGADKVILNTSFYDEKLVRILSNNYGSQSISAMIDYKLKKNKKYIYTNSGSISNKWFKNYSLLNFQKNNFGDLIFNSIDRDGTGQGLDLSILKSLSKIKNPIILMGGSGKPEHIVQALKLKDIDGVCTSNIFNFLGNGLHLVRKKLFEMKINIANF